MRDAEALPHAQGVVPDPSVGLGVGETDELEHFGDPGRRQPHRLAREGEDLAAGAAGVLGGGVEQDADLQARVGQVGEAAADDGCGASGCGGQADENPQRRGLPGTVRAKETGHPAGVRRERDVVHGGERVVPLGDRLDADHRDIPVVMAILPRTRPASRCRMAAGASVSG